MEGERYLWDRFWARAAFGAGRGPGAGAGGRGFPDARGSNSGCALALMTIAVLGGHQRQLPRPLSLSYSRSLSPTLALSLLLSLSFSYSRSLSPTLALFLPVSIAIAVLGGAARWSWRRRASSRWGSRSSWRRRCSPSPSRSPCRRGARYSRDRNNDRHTGVLCVCARAIGVRAPPSRSPRFPLSAWCKVQERCIGGGGGKGGW